jgi:hypothetical protein
MTRDRAVREHGSPGGWPEYLHDVAWGIPGADGETARIGCTCGWEGTRVEFDQHINALPYGSAL